MTNKELIRAFEMIRKYCLGRKCDWCIFLERDHCCIDDVPEKWRSERINVLKGGDEKCG